MAKKYPSGLTDGEMRGLSERARHCCYWIEKYVIVEGAYLRLAPYQVKFIKHFMVGDVGGPRTITRGWLSTARKSGKSSVASAITLYSMTAKGCPHGSDFFFAAAGSQEQGWVLFDYLAAMVYANPKLANRYTINPMGRKLRHLTNGNRLVALSTSPRSAQGRKAAGFAFDELAQAKDGGRLLNSLDMASPKISTGQGWGIIVSTNSDIAGNVMADQIAAIQNAQRAGSMKEHYLQIHAPTKDMGLFSDAALIAANPGLQVYDGQEPLIEWEVLNKSREAAKHDAQARSFYKTYRLNLATATNKLPLVDVERWIELGVDKSEAAEMRAKTKGDRVSVGIDLSSALDLTSVSLYFSDSGFATSMSWLPEDRVELATTIDRNPYAEWAEDGWLRLCAGKTIDYRDIAEYIKEILADYQVEVIRYDDWKWSSLKESLRAVGIDPEDEVFQDCRQGYKTFTGLIGHFELLVESGYLKHENSPVMNQAAFGAGIEESPNLASGARRITKQSRNQRIDPIVALLMAIGPADEETEKKPTSMNLDAYYEGW